MRQFTDEWKKHMSEAHKGLKHSEKTKYKMSLSAMGNQRWLGRKHTEEEKQKIGRAHKGIKYSEESKMRISESQKRRVAEGRYIKKHTEQTKKKMSKTRKMIWQNEEYAKKIMIHVKPNHQEMVLNNILAIYFPDEWKYVGNGELVVAGKCPDFMNINGKKALIELFGDYWHRGENPKDRIKIFEPYGYKTLVIWENELKNPNRIISKVFNAFYQCDDKWATNTGEREKIECRS